jgi:extracellular factor (EF) 3-hydroxypalmitic acid methyl ester biosynthesis protein
MPELLTATDTKPTTYPGTALFEGVRQLMALGERRVALDGLRTALNQLRRRMEPDEWSAFARDARRESLASILDQDPMTRRAYEKPRGYAGDAVMMDYLYGLYGYHDASARASRIGREIFEWVRRTPTSESVRLRRQHVADLVDELAATRRPEVLAIAAGHLREVELSTAIASGRTGRVVALDADADSLREIATRYGHLGIQTVKASVRDLLARKCSLGRFDFVYASGLFDYLSDSTAAALTARMFELTKPGGRLLIPNFTPRCAEAGYMEAFMAWHLIYRDEFDMTKLVEPIPPQRIASYDIYSDRTGSIVYLLVRKAE